MSSALKLEHIGEELVTAMLKSSPKVQEHILGERISDMARIIPELPLGRWCDRIFDGAHRVDVAVVENDFCFPIELKLGLSRMSTTEFTNRFLTPVSTSHGDKRIKGGMISILERLWNGREDEFIEVCALGANHRLTRPWALVVRGPVTQKWSETQYPNLSPYCKLVTLEELVEVFGSPSEFNELVKELVDGDYYNDWFAV